MKKIVRKFIRRYCPDVPFIRKKLNQIKLSEINKYNMSKEDIVKGEESFENKKQIVSKYCSLWSNQAKKICDKLYEYLEKSNYFSEKNDETAKAQEMIRINVLFDYFAYGFTPDEYFEYEFDKKANLDKTEYISDRDRYNYVYKINDFVELNIFYDKYETYKKFSKYYKRDIVSVFSKKDYSKFKNFVKKYPVFVQKNTSLSRGESVELVDFNKIEKDDKDYFLELISKGKFIVEELVVQSQKMMSLNPSSVNTIRCITFNTKSGPVIGSCFIKIGQGNSFIDNGGAGGILAGINSQTGVIETVGYDEFLNEYTYHPDTKVKICGYQIPQWEELIKIAKELAAQTGKVHYVGWDFAHTSDGWVVIEGNGGGQFIGPQIVWKKGIKKEIEDIVSDSLLF